MKTFSRNILIISISHSLKIQPSEKHFTTHGFPVFIPTSQISSNWFFFSSRRQHTSWNCDWSSDVCSSDLCEPTGANDPTCSSQCVRIDSTGTAYLFTFDQDPQGWTLYATSPERLESGSSVAYDAQNRSEERRVGKEWRAWSLWYREITKT